MTGRYNPSTNIQSKDIDLRNAPKPQAAPADAHLVSILLYLLVAETLIGGTFMTASSAMHTARLLECGFRGHRLKLFWTVQHNKCFRPTVPRVQSSSAGGTPDHPQLPAI